MYSTIKSVLSDEYRKTFEENLRVVASVLKHKEFKNTPSYTIWEENVRREDCAADLCSSCKIWRARTITSTATILTRSTRWWYVMQVKNSHIALWDTRAVSMISESLPTRRRDTSSHHHFPSSHYHIVGNSAFQLQQYVMVPYKDTGALTVTQLNYNRRLSQTRCIVENSFGFLKGRD